MTLTLTTARLTLRPPEISDALAVTRYLNNFAVAGNLATVPYPYCVSDAQNWLSRQSGRPPQETGFALDLEGAGYVGQVGFHQERGGATLGYWLGEPFWYRGLMTEAVTAVVAWYFSAVPDAKILSGVFHFNKASLAIQKKLGFVVTATSRRHCLARGEEVRHIDTELTRAAWTERLQT